MLITSPNVICWYIYLAASYFTCDRSVQQLHYQFQISFLYLALAKPIARIEQATYGVQIRRSTN